MDKTTRQIVADLNTGVRPQDDLYAHVNGRWLETAEIPADQSETGGFMDLHLKSEADVREIIEAAASGESENERKIAALYGSFMDEGRINGLGPSPLTDDCTLIDDAADKDSLEVVAGQLFETGVAIPFGVEVEVDRNNPEAYIPWMYQSGLGLPDEAYYREEQYAPYLAEYRKFAPTIISLALELTDTDAKEAAERVIGFETKLASHHMSVVDSRDADKTNNLMNWDELAKFAPGFDWRAGLEALGLSPEKAPQFLVMTPEALKGFAKEWDQAQLDDLKLYLKWRAVLARAPFLSADIAQTNFNFYGKVLSGTQQMRDRWKRGVSLVNGVLGEAVGELYVAKHFPASHKEAMNQLVADLLEAYRRSISDLDWMTSETKERALAKLSKISTKIGYPEKWKDYSKLELTDNLISNVRAAARFSWREDLDKLGGPIDHTEWHMNPQTVNAYYSPVSNEIVFPAAILQPPFFDADADPALNYGGIGAVIGHEVGHAFDDQGSKYDGNGKLNNWWTDADRAEFEKRTAALVGQYDAYKPAQLGADTEHHVNGQLTLGENIGDLGGLSIALKAYGIALEREGAADAAGPEIEGYTGIQRVFLNWARVWQSKRRDEIMVQRLAVDPHSPAEFRCNGAVKNVDAFADAFGLTEGDALYLPPEERVRIW